MQKIDWKALWSNRRKYLPNKYLLTIIVFAIILLFVGNHSVLNRLRMAHRERDKKTELREYHQKIEATEAQLRSLDEPGALEKYAREEYLMHADNEDVYLIDEE